MLNVGLCNCRCVYLYECYLQIHVEKITDSEISEGKSKEWNCSTRVHLRESLLGGAVLS